MKRKTRKASPRYRYDRIEVSSSAPEDDDSEIVFDEGGSLDGGMLGVPWWIWVLGATGAVTVVAYFLTRVQESDMPLVGSPVLRRERAIGVAPLLTQFLDWWEANGPFPITVMTLGGVRTDEAEQRRLYALGRTKAKTLAETPHGRGGALDLYPTIGGVIRGLEADPNPREAEGYFKQMGTLAKQFGLTWGGDWWSIKDLPHVEVKNWRDLPYPPNNAVA